MAIPYWRLSGFYFFYFATVGGLLPYWSLYLKDSGFNAIQIGELSALLISTKIVAPNIWGWIADHTGKSLRLIRLASLFAALVFAGFLITEHYLGFAVVTLVFSFFWNAVLPQFEAVTLFHLKEHAYRYSKIRLWGSVGFIITVLSTGRLLDTEPVNFLPWVVIGLLGLSWLVTLLTPEANIRSSNVRSVGLGQILKKPEVIAFFVVNILVQMAHSPYYVFYSLYLKSNHYSATVTGLLWSLGVVCEIVLFIYMSQLLKNVSLRNILLVSLLLSAMRWFVIAWFPETLVLMTLAQLLHAATFGGVHVAAIHLVHLYFGAEHQGKGQALYASLSFGIGGIFGSLYSGYYWESLGGRFVYSIAALLCILAWFICYRWVGRKNTQKVYSIG